MATARDLYTARAGLYSWWTRLFRQEQALRSLFEAAGVLRPDLRILDAGCGSGATTLALVSALRRRGLDYRSIDAFDLTAAMLDRFHEAIRRGRLEAVQLREADVLALEEELPPSWTGYDLVVCTSMLEYVAPDRLAQALASLGRLLAPDGALLVVITKRSALARVLVERLWNARGYGADELGAALENAGLSRIERRRFPPRAFWMNTTNQVAVARP